MTIDKAAAIKTAEAFADLMDRAAAGGPGGDDRSWNAMKVVFYLTDSFYWGDPAPTVEEAILAARRAWGDDIPDTIRAALGIEHQAPAKKVVGYKIPGYPAESK